MGAMASLYDVAVCLSVVVLEEGMLEIGRRLAEVAPVTSPAMREEAIEGLAD